MAVWQSCVKWCFLFAECQVANNVTEILNRVCTNDGDCPEQRPDQVHLDIWTFFTFFNFSFFFFSSPLCFSLVSWACFYCCIFFLFALLNTPDLTNALCSGSLCENHQENLQRLWDYLWLGVKCILTRKYIENFTPVTELPGSAF